MPAIPIYSADELTERILALPRPGEENVLAFYDHRLGGIARCPRLMLIPLDDHLAHRGDGIFETVKYVAGKMYQLDDHIARMRRSAEGIHLEPPCSWEEVRHIVLQTAAAGGEPDGQMRILLGRGPGGFGIDPAESPTASLYMAAYRFTPPAESWYAKGLKGFRTSVPAKQGYLARIKNANYLPNVLMIHEANERHMDVPFCFDDENFLAESAVANICLVNRQGELDIPLFTRSLPGTTVRRAVELLEGTVVANMRRITEEDIRKAREVLMLGTGPDCVGVVEYEGAPIADGKPGEVTNLLRRLIQRDMRDTGVSIPL